MHRHSTIMPRRKFYFLAISILFATWISPAAAKLRPVEKSALMEFAYAMGYNRTWSTPRGVNLTWDMSTDPCENGESWSSSPGKDPFFICDSTNTTLIRIYMNNINMTGVIPDSFGNAMSNLTVLNMGTNYHMQGQLPATFGNMSKLQELYVDLSELKGPIPASFAGLTNLRNFYFQDNSITSFPVGAIQNMKSLQNLWFFNNPLLRIDLQAFNNSAALVQLLGSSCLVNGTLSSLANLSNLKQLDLRNNTVTGVIPANLFTKSGFTLSVGMNQIDLSTLTRNQVCSQASLSSCDITSQTNSCLANGGSTSTTCNKCKVNFCSMSTSSSTMTSTSSSRRTTSSSSILTTTSAITSTRSSASSSSSSTPSTTSSIVTTSSQDAAGTMTATATPATTSSASSSSVSSSQGPTTTTLTTASPVSNSSSSSSSSSASSSSSSSAVSSSMTSSTTTETSTESSASSSSASSSDVATSSQTSSASPSTSSAMTTTDSPTTSSASSMSSSMTTSSVITPDTTPTSSSSSTSSDVATSTVSSSATSSESTSTSSSEISTSSSDTTSSATSTVSSSDMSSTATSSDLYSTTDSTMTTSSDAASSSSSEMTSSTSSSTTSSESSTSSSSSATTSSDSIPSTSSQSTMTSSSSSSSSTASSDAITTTATESSSSSGSSAMTTSSDVASTSSTVSTTSATSTPVGGSTQANADGGNASKNGGSSFPIGAVVGGAAGGLLATGLVAWLVMYALKKRQQQKQVLPLESGMLNSVYLSGSTTYVPPPTAALQTGGYWASFLKAIGRPVTSTVPASEAAKWTSARGSMVELPSALETKPKGRSTSLSRGSEMNLLQGASLPRIDEAGAAAAGPSVPTAMEAPFDPVKEGVNKAKWNHGTKLAPLGAKTPAPATTPAATPSIPELASKDLLTRNNVKQGGTMGRLSLKDLSGATETAIPPKEPVTREKDITQLQQSKARRDSQLQTGGTWATRRAPPSASAAKKAV